jgi:hypothetical protein
MNDLPDASDRVGKLDRRTFLARSLGAALLVPVAGAALGALAGCGEGSKSTTPTPAPMPASPAAPPQPAPAAAPAVPAAPPAAAPAAVPGAQAGSDKLITEIPANASLVSSLQYVNESNVKGQQCVGCQLFTPVGTERGKCVLFQAGLVMAKGHCSSWIQKTA